MSQNECVAFTCVTFPGHQGALAPSLGVIEVCFLVSNLHQLWRKMKLRVFPFSVCRWCHLVAVDDSSASLHFNVFSFRVEEEAAKQVNKDPVQKNEYWDFPPNRKQANSAAAEKRRFEFLTF